MSYNKEKINRSRFQKKNREERQQKEKERIDNIRTLLLKNKGNNLPGYNVMGYGLDEHDNIVKL